MHLHYTQADSDEGGRQSKMAANSKSHAISQTAYAGVDNNFHKKFYVVYCSFHSLTYLNASVLSILSFIWTTITNTAWWRVKAPNFQLVFFLKCAIFCWQIIHKIYGILTITLLSCKAFCTDTFAINTCPTIQTWSWAIRCYKTTRRRKM